MRKRILLLIALPMFLAGCLPERVSPPAAPDPQARVCTEIGCRSVLSIHLTDVDVEGDTTYEVEVCVEGECSGASVAIDTRNDADEAVLGEAEGIVVRADEDLVEYPLPGDGYGETAEVSFTLTDAEGVLLAEAEEEVPLERSQPNGPGCPPVCFSGRLTV